MRGRVHRSRAGNARQDGSRWRTLVQATDRPATLRQSSGVRYSPALRLAIGRPDRTKESAWVPSNATITASMTGSVTSSSATQSTRQLALWPPAASRCSTRKSRQSREGTALNQDSTIKRSFRLSRKTAARCPVQAHGRNRGSRPPARSRRGCPPWPHPLAHSAEPSPPREQPAPPR